MNFFYGKRNEKQENFAEEITDPMRCDIRAFGMWNEIRKFFIIECGSDVYRSDVDGSAYTCSLVIAIDMNNEMENNKISENFSGD